MLLNYIIQSLSPVELWSVSAVYEENPLLLISRRPVVIQLSVEQGIMVPLLE